jgi:hypothetical protein
MAQALSVQSSQSTDWDADQAQLSVGDSDMSEMCPWKPNALILLFHNQMG